ncbi:Serine/threonine-protein kinase srk1 [Lasiodiplodia hormozganensis]|uniref:Serine/threonine-protein kinase srk1 n=2 Tax=Lasiodiplodia TaxID=66739 RepID=A0A5N5DF86_9PEZI|nr:Camk protein kinase [Lasiodiplodia theobromae]KAB2576458.1 Serine/threonine-protein kinase srk1 [Lasiodiplodia theobromae]KAF4543939.1 Camk protein kinase [Lasiodiplodia theobromae]KAK0664130.1 Serine/threonine-protein kinase srk1 [Lasiodiplodia hormozganensis]
MAPAEDSPTFQKLRLNTRPSPKPIPSAFASIKRSDGEHPGSPFPELDERFWPHEDSAVALTNSELTDNAFPSEHEGMYAPDKRSWLGRKANDEYMLSGSSRHSPSLEQAFSQRHRAISFAPKVTLDGGDRFPMDAPLPRPDSYASLKDARLGVERGAAIEEGHDSHGAVHIRNNSETDKARYDACTGEPMEIRQRRPGLPYRTGQSRHPLLQETVDDLAKDAEIEENDRVASLTSGTTVSTNDGSLTPLEAPADYLQSPLAASSPIDFASAHSSYFPSSRRTSSARSRSFYSDKGSLRRSSRRTSTRSGNSSMSPASAFLSQWGREEASSVIEPDDEGQEIPDQSGYFIGKQIGFGGFSVVKEVSTIQDGVKIIRAVKIVRKQVTGKDEAENEKLQTEFEHEVEIWRYLKHPYILPLLTVYDSPFATFCITKLNTGGTLFDLIRANRKAGKPALPSKLAKRYLYQLASALRYLHEDVHVVHRDVKLENCLLDMSEPEAKTEGGNVLLCDFGMADFITNENRNLPSPLEESAYSHVGPSDTSTCINGSLDYASPELLHARTPLYSPAVDMWAYGVIAYTLLTGKRPFTHNFQPALVMLITKGEWDEEALREAGVDEDAIDLVRGCLEMDPQLRCTVSDVLDCPWFDGCSELYEEVRREWVDSN